MVDAEDLVLFTLINVILLFMLIIIIISIHKFIGMYITHTITDNMSQNMDYSNAPPTSPTSESNRNRSASTKPKYMKSTGFIILQVMYFGVLMTYLIGILCGWVYGYFFTTKSQDIKWISVMGSCFYVTSLMMMLLIYGFRLHYAFKDSVFKFESYKFAILSMCTAFGICSFIAGVIVNSKIAKYACYTVFTVTMVSINVVLFRCFLKRIHILVSQTKSLSVSDNKLTKLATKYTVLITITDVKTLILFSFLILTNYVDKLHFSLMLWCIIGCDSVINSFCMLCSVKIGYGYYNKYCNIPNNCCNNCWTSKSLSKPQNP